DNAPAALADALEPYLRDAALAAAAADRGRALVERRYTWSAVAAAMEQVYEEAVRLHAGDPHASKAMASPRVILCHAPHRSPCPLGDLPRGRALPRAPAAAACERVQRHERLPAAVQLRARPPRRADRAGARGVGDVERRDVQRRRGAAWIGAEAQGRDHP